MSTLADRIIEARTEAGISEPAELARRVGVKAAAAYQWESGATKSLKDVTLVELADALDVSPRWLATGRPPKRPSHSVPRFETSPGYLRFQVMGEGGAGPGVINPNEPEVLREIDIAQWSVENAIGRIVSPDRVKLLTVRGDSMLPKIRRGDVVFVDMEDRAVRDGGIFVFIFHDEAVVKRLDIRSDGFHIVSLADPDRPDVIPADRMSEVHIAGRVLGAIQLRDTSDLAYL